ncbi:MAG: hypothetical protein ABW065_08355 [Solirubrobacterales bacterium]
MKRLSLVVVSAVALAVAIPTFASGADTTSPVPATGKTDTIYIRDGKAGLRFVGPQTVGYGDMLKIVSQTDAKKVGPHTLSLVEASLVPKTKPQRKLCFTPNHICKAIADWHGVKGNGPPTINPVDAGPAGWSTEGNLKEKGDSWFTGQKPNATFEEQVTAEAGTTIHYICAVHPWMHGSFKVEAPPATS